MSLNAVLNAALDRVLSRLVAGDDAVAACAPDCRFFVDDRGQYCQKCKTPECTVVVVCNDPV